MFKESVHHNVHCLKMSRTIMGKPLRATYSFFIDGLVIDGGSPYFKEHLYRIHNSYQPNQTIFTHCHEDHAGNVDLFNQLDITPYVHEKAISYLSGPPSIPFYRRFVWGKPATGRCQEVSEHIKTEKHTFQVIPTPGHSPDHLCLFEEREGWLFTGDLYVGERVYYLYESENLTEIKKSLEKLSTLNFSTLFCSHRGPVVKGPETLVRKLAYIENLQEKALQMKKNGYHIKQITKKLLGGEDYMYIISRGQFSKTAFVKALISER